MFNVVMFMMQNMTKKGVSLVFRASEGRGPQKVSRRQAPGPSYFLAALALCPPPKAGTWLRHWLWLQEGGLKRETETLIMAAQEQAVRTNLVKVKIDKTQEDSTCRMCGKADESINHLLSECSKMAQKEYKRRHDWIGRKIHWEVCRKYGLDTKDRWYEHEPQSVCENEEYKILLDFSIQTDHVIEARRPDMIIVEKKNNNNQIIDFAVPFDTRVDEKEKEKIFKYQDLARELKKLWNKKVKVIPVIIGALGTAPKALPKRLKEIGIATRIVELQKTVLLQSARILRQMLEI